MFQKKGSFLSNPSFFLHSMQPSCHCFTQAVVVDGFNSDFHLFLSRLLPAALDDPGEHVDVDVLADLGLARLVLGVLGDLDHVTLDLPAAGFRDELGGGLGVVKAEPALEHGELDLAVRLADELGDAHADHVLEAGNVGGQVGVQVVAVERGPEAGVLGTLELGVEGAQLGDGLGELRARVGARVGLRGAEEVEREVELGRGELGHGLDEDVGDDLILDAVGVELVAVLVERRGLVVSKEGCSSRLFFC